MSAAATSVLLVEDNRADARLLEATLQDAGGHRFRFIHVQRLAEALAALVGGGVDVVLLDLNLPDSQGLDTLAELQRERPGVPVVVLTGLNDEELAVRAVQAGAQDYLPKEVFDGGLLARLIRHAIERHQIGVELERAQNEQLRLRDQFLTHISHELRTPLAAMHQFLDILADGIAGRPSRSSSVTSTAPCAMPASWKPWSPSCSKRSGRRTTSWRSSHNASTSPRCCSRTPSTASPARPRPSTSA